MAQVYDGRYTAHIDGDFVVFLIGMRVNKLWKPQKWIPVAREMGPMLKTLFGNPEKGMLGARFGWMGGPLVVQYWRSFTDLDHFARSAAEPHRPAWQRYNKNVKSSGEVGIWHETFKVRAGEYECVYGNMPRVGLAAAAEHQPVVRKSESAAQRIGAVVSEAEPPGPESSL
ncbi:MAG TPA: DUF4188 domain-containing protein [Actinomycetota bacterium]|nr:DUF4188 domain-containing protein [Actinomycetota bacterium]